LPPEVVLGIVRSASSPTPDPRLGPVLEGFRERWLALGRRRYRHVQDDLEDAAQTALMKLVATDKLDTLREVERIEAWARSIFVRAVLDLTRGALRQSDRNASGGTPEDAPEHALRDALPHWGPSPEDLASHRERLAIVARAASRLEVARLKFFEDLPEKEIAARQGLTRHGVAGQVKRIRATIRQALEASEATTRVIASGMATRASPRLRATIMALVAAVWWGHACPCWADPPTASLGRVPVCGDQGDGTAQLKCADLAPIPDIEVFRVPGQGAVDLTFDFVFAEVAAPNELGFFRVDDLNGTVGRVSPAETGYLAGALARAAMVFPAGSTPTGADTTVRASGGDMLVFFIMHGGSLGDFSTSNPTNDPNKLPLAFFSLSRLNPDPDSRFAGDHVVGFQSLTTQTTEFAFEDLSAFSDWDFDDLVYTVSARLERPTCEGPDTDRDGIVDSCDTCPLVVDPEQPDTDRDLVGDACDNCRRVPNFGQDDADGNGHGDACSLETCSDGRDNDGDGLADGADPACPALRIERVSYPITGARVGNAVVVTGIGFVGARGALEVGRTAAPVTAWRARKVTFRMPRLVAGAYPVQVIRDAERSDRGEVFVPSPGRLGVRRARRALAGLLGGTSWWGIYAGDLRHEKNLANPLRLREALQGGDAAQSEFVAAAIRSIDATRYGASTNERRAAARAFDECGRRYLWQMPDQLLDQHLACTGYPGPTERFRLLPPDVQLRILNVIPAPRATSCFVESAYHLACRDTLHAMGVGEPALSTLGF
jgi:RNA polymerase sigma factor (sigma-70 family)